MKFLKYDFYLNAGDLVKVELSRTANVQLMDFGNYWNYKNRKPYNYYGGSQKVSPAGIVAPYAGHWHLCIDLGGYSGSVAASVEVIRS